MSFNLIELASGVLTPNLTKKLAEYINENPTNTQAAVDAVIPSLAGIVSRQASSPAGASSLLDLLSPGRLNTGFLENLTGFFDESGAMERLSKMGSGLTAALLGPNINSVSRVVSETAGVREGSASALLNLLSPIVLGLLGKEIVQRGASAGELSTLLTSTKEAIQKLAPASLAKAVGVGSVAEMLGSGAQMVGAYSASAASSASPKVAAYGQTTTAAPKVGAYEEPKRGLGWWVWALPLALLLLGGLWFYRNRSALPTVNLASIALPCGTTLKVMEGSFNFTLANFMLHGASAEMPKRIVFDNLNFDSGTTQLTAESNLTVDNLAAIMKCYPNMQVRLGGHTDNTGDAAANHSLSLDRAEKIKGMLVQDGIDGSRIATAGFGQDQPIASNDTEEGKAKNRRTELEVTAK
jgi:OmpA-OmpF porin, OOP family